MKKHWKMIFIIFLALGVSMILWGVMLTLVTPQTPNASLIILSLTFCGFVSVLFLVKTFLFFDKREGKNSFLSNKDRHELHVFNFVFLLSLLLFLTLLQFAVGFIPLTEEERQPVVIEATRNVVEEEIVEEYETEPVIEEKIEQSETITVIPEEPTVIVEPPVAEEIVPIEQLPVVEEKEEEEYIPPIQSEVIIPETTTPVVVPSKPQFAETTITAIPSKPQFAEVITHSSVPEKPEFVSVTQVPNPPSVPTFNSNERALVPDKPVFTEPERAFAVPVIIPVEEEVDPWADFFVSGDQLDILDGIYWFDLYINGNATGTITVNVENGEISLLQEELKSYCSDLITTEAMNRIFAEEREWMSVLLLNSLGVDTFADTISYTVDMTFSPEDMPIQVISISGSNSVSKARPISGATVLSPASWYLVSYYSNYLSFSNLEEKNQFDRFRYSLYSSNNFRIKDVYGNYSWGLSATNNAFAINWGSYSFHKDFKSEMIRLQWGNVSPDLQGTNGISVGVRFDKSNQYGDGTRKGSSLNKTISIEKDSDVRVYNGENEIYRRTLIRGVYRLEDFTLYTGANHIRIVITPLDGSEVEEYEMDVNYSSSLLQPGEKYYGAALAFGRRTVAWDSEREDYQFDLWLLNNKKLRYDVRDFAVSSYLNIGITNTLTGYFAASFKNTPSTSSNFNPALRFNSEYTYANRFGTAKININLNSQTINNKLSIPSIYARASEQIYTGWKTMSALTLSVGYTSPTNWEKDDKHFLYMSAALSGSIFSLSYALSISGTYVPDYSYLSSWYLSTSLSFSLGRVGISVSNTFSQNGNYAVTHSARISASFKLGKVSNNVSGSKEGVALSSSAGWNNTSIWMKASTSDVKDIDKYSFAVDLSRSGKLFNMGGALSFDGRFKKVNGSLSVTTSTLIAEKGLWTIASSIPNNFLLIRQKGIIKKNTLSVGTVGASSQEMAATILGDTLYKRLSSNSGTSLSLYSFNDSSFGDAETYNIYIPYSEQNGYVLLLEGKETFTLAGTITDNEGTLWSNGSSPVYRLVRDEEGNISLDPTELYLFTDRQGIFVLSDLEKGEYVFDTKEDGSWVMNILEVGDMNRYDKVGMVISHEATFDDALPYPYQKTRLYTFDRNITTDEFWNLIYGEETL